MNIKDFNKIVTTPLITSYRKHRVILKELDDKILHSIDMALSLELNVILELSIITEHSEYPDDNHTLFKLKTMINDSVALFSHNLWRLTTLLNSEKIDNVSESKTAVEITRILKDFDNEMEEVQVIYSRIRLDNLKKVA